MSKLHILARSLILSASLLACADEAATSAIEPPPSTDTGDPNNASGEPDAAPAATLDAAQPVTIDAAPAPAPLPAADAAQPSGLSCRAGALLCCDAVVAATQPGISDLLILLGIQVQLLTDPIGLVCVPTAAVEACPRVPTCCTNNALIGIAALGCFPPEVVSQPTVRF